MTTSMPVAGSTPLELDGLGDSAHWGVRDEQRPQRRRRSKYEPNERRREHPVHAPCEVVVRAGAGEADEREHDHQRCKAERACQH